MNAARSELLRHLRVRSGFDASQITERMVNEVLQPENEHAMRLARNAGYDVDSENGMSLCQIRGLVRDARKSLAI